MRFPFLKPEGLVEGLPQEQTPYFRSGKSLVTIGSADARPGESRLDHRESSIAAKSGRRFARE